MKISSVRKFGIILLIATPFLLLVGLLQGMMSDTSDVSPSVAGFLAGLWLPYSLFLFICSILLVFNVHFAKKPALALIIYFPIAYVANMIIALSTKNLNMAIAYWAICISLALVIYLLINRFLGNKQKAENEIMRKHVTVLGILYISSSILLFLITIVDLIFVIVESCSVENKIKEMSAGVLFAIVLFLVLSSLIGIAGGIGLIKKYFWARTLVLTLGFINLLLFPLGTPLGIYTIWVLKKEETIKLFTDIEA